MFTFTIGLEIHVQLKTKSKMFCRCSNDGENQPPNTTICPVCTGHPGVLPVLNGEAVHMGAKMALAINCILPDTSKFDRKNYFYPDLPKAYQISQYDQPIGKNGYLDIGERRIRINRLHLEEDAAKLVHTQDKKSSLVDFNRCSTPLMEIVTEPDFVSPSEAKIFLQELRLIARYLDVSSADMEKGHLRCDANVSINVIEDGRTIQTPISEIKNLNSFRAVEKALEYEGNRLHEDWTAGGESRKRTNKITVGWDETQGVTLLQRGKEEAHDYRYFPEPDLPPITFTDDERATLRAEIPELPAQRRIRFIEEYGITTEDARILIDTKETGEFFERAASEVSEWLCTLEKCDEQLKQKSYKLLASLLIHKIPALLGEQDLLLSETKLTAENLAECVALSISGKVNSTALQTILEETLNHGANPTTVMKEKNLEQIEDTGALETACDTVFGNNPDAVASYKAGKVTAIMFLVGQVMKDMKGKAQPEKVKDILEKKLSL
ncbi:Asp-tRNA(Asn)/Glu-tRNA(Gln) amidotransferase subunit GatB [Candidatus Uhrbacteria bacterium]|nr:Asp-tRNA(Asn)/Glu-tRNA(Gln) amidotransferase subunit GatB [Candidatus Uhrbacteria bacterium]